MGIIAVLVLALINCNYVLSLTIYNVTACRESSNLCAELHLDKCSNNSMMYLSEMKYGTKNEPDIISCNETEQACFKDGVGCCSNSGRDCFNNYTARNAYDIYKMCSGKSECVSRAAGHFVHCFDKYAWTTYSTIWYSCISVSDVIRFCDDAVTTTKSAHIIFDKTNQSSLCGRSNCSCILSSTENLTVTHIDVRMAKIHTDKVISYCSSAVLVSDPNVYKNIQCNKSLDEHEHFEFKVKNKTFFSKLSLELRDLYANGLDDSPEFVWILVEADKNADITVKCNRTPTICTNSTTGSTTIPDSSTTSTNRTDRTPTNTRTDSTSTSTNTTENTSISTSTIESTRTSTPKSSTTIDTISTTEIITAETDASSRVAVISGVTASVGLLVMLTVFAVCFYIIKRRRNRQPETKPTIPINSATEHHDSGRLSEPDYDNAPDLRVIRLGDGYIDFAASGHPGSQNTALAWPSNNVKQRPILPRRPPLSEQNSRHNFPEPKPCCNVSNVHHLRDNKNDCDGHQLQHSGLQSQARDQEVFDYMEPLSAIWPLSANDLRTIIDQTGNGNSSDRSSNKSHEKDSIDGSSKLLARKIFKIDGQDVHSIVIDMRLVTNK